MKNFYKILRIHPNATDSEIKEAYEKRLLKCLPTNHFIDFDQDENFEDIQESYEVLSDQSKRMAYDKDLQASISGLEDEDKTEKSTQFEGILGRMMQSGKFRPAQNNLGLPTVMIVLLIGIGLAVFYGYNHNTTLASGPENENIMTTETGQSIMTEPAVLESTLDPGEDAREDARKENLRARFQLISDGSRSFEEKNLAIEKTLPLFESKNSHVVVIGLNDTPVRRQTVHDYLDFLLINGHKVVIKSVEQNEKGKITQLELSEQYNDGL